MSRELCLEDIERLAASSGLILLSKVQSCVADNGVSEGLRICDAVQRGGLWVNLGPLQYHWADAHNYLPSKEVSIELCLEDIEKLAAASGFAMLSKEMVPASFNQDPRRATNPFCSQPCAKDASLHASVSCACKT